MKKKTSIGGLIDWLQLNSKVGWGIVHISWFSDGEFIEGWKINFDNKFYEGKELYDVLLQAKKNIEDKPKETCRDLGC